MKQITCPHCADTYPDLDAAHVCSKGPYAPRLKPKMNERFKQLAEQANIGLFEDKSFGWNVIAGTDQHLEKFAELIVRECANIADEYDGAGSTIVSRIEKHFGVES